MGIRRIWALLAFACLMGSCAGPEQPLVFDGSAAYANVQAQCDLGPRPTGSAAARATGDYIIAQLEGQGWLVETQEFTYRETPVRNIVGRS